MASPRFARRERHALCDLLLDLGPEAPTLCGDWRTRQLAAHLFVRERRPIGAVGIVVPPLEGLAEQATTRVARRDYRRLVAAVRSPGLTPWALPPVESLANSIEFLVHHEDVRRARPGWTPRVLPEPDEDLVWRRLWPMAALLVRRAGVPVRLARSDADASRTLVRGEDPVTVRGRPSELALFLLGREQVHEVDLLGPDERVARLRAADRSF